MGRKVLFTGSVTEVVVGKEPTTEIAIGKFVRPVLAIAALDDNGDRNCRIEFPESCRIVDFYGPQETDSLQFERDAGGIHWLRIRGIAVYLGENPKNVSLENLQPQETCEIQNRSLVTA